MGRKRRKNQPNQTTDIQTADAVAQDELLTEETSEETEADEEQDTEAVITGEEYVPEQEIPAEEYLSEKAVSEEAFFEKAQMPTEELLSEETLSEEALPDGEVLNDEELRKLVEEDLARNAEEETVETDEASATYHDESLGSFIGEMLVNLRAWVGKNRSFCIFTVFALVICIAVIIIAGRLNRGTPAGTGVVSANVITGETPVVTDAIPLPPDPLAEDAVPEINDLINRYFDAMESGDLDTFLSIRSYTDSVEKAKFEAKC